MASEVKIDVTSFSGNVDLISFKPWSPGGRVGSKLRRGGFYTGIFEGYKNLLIERFARKVETGSLIKFFQIITPGNKMEP